MPSQPTSNPENELAGILPASGRLMGLDLGSKTIGVALSDTRQTIATPLETIRRKQFTLDAERLNTLVEEHSVVGLIVGLPLNMDGSEGPSAQSARAFARNFGARSPLPIGFWDERLSTLAVTRTMLEADLSRARRAEIVDKLAAGYVLQGALDRLQHARGTDNR
ncbi:MAG: Holliday junction resolvase RuvX [Cucumibacter sp.]